MNKVILIGRLTRDTELIGTQGGTSFLKNSIAVDRKFKKDGEQTADFINILAFGKTAEFINTYFSKGNRMAITGRIQTGSYTNKEGVKAYTTDVVVEDCEFVESKNQGEQKERVQSDANGFVNVPDGIDDELPFN